ncbi:DnaD domain-containing protein [Paenibacillus sp. y28]|uniref:DnaD domain-containing protein n=1 Tax=Paenibacillus sp. y28 TaxID=3129110 RepID=UPI0030186B9D
MKKNEVRHMEDGLLAALQEGNVSVPAILLKAYRKLDLSDSEVLLMIHLLAFKERENKEFPTIEELQERMSATPEQVIVMLQKLMKQGLLAIDEDVDALSGVRYERYNMLPLLAKLAEVWTKELLEREEQSEEPAGKDRKDVFSLFEKEFARPLTPMEFETISGWLDQDRYPEELILTALKEAVFAGKVHFRYIDRILLEWSRNRVFTAEQAKEYAQRFRGGR